MVVLITFGCEGDGCNGYSFSGTQQITPGNVNNGACVNSSTCGSDIMSLQLFYPSVDPGSVLGIGRDPLFSAWQPTLNILNNGQIMSPADLNTNALTMNYCEIQVISADCSDWGPSNNGGAFYLWDNSNDGDNNNTAMDICVPAQGAFQVKIRLWENCGAYYLQNAPVSSVPYGRARYYASKTVTYQSILAITDWTFFAPHPC